MTFFFLRGARRRESTREEEEEEEEEGEEETVLLLLVCGDVDDDGASIVRVKDPVCADLSEVWAICVRKIRVCQSFKIKPVIRVFNMRRNTERGGGWESVRVLVQTFEFFVRWSVL